MLVPAMPRMFIATIELQFALGGLEVALHGRAMAFYKSSLRSFLLSLVMGWFTPLIEKL